MSDHKATQALVADYYKKSSKYSKSILFLAIVGVATVIVSAVWVYQVNHKLDVRTKAIQTQINCVGEYFTQTDRATIRIPSLQSCNIERIK